MATSIKSFVVSVESGIVDAMAAVDNMVNDFMGGSYAPGVIKSVTDTYYGADQMKDDKSSRGFPLFVRVITHI